MAEEAHWMRLPGKPKLRDGTLRRKLRKVTHIDPDTGEREIVNMKQRPNDDIVFRRLEHSMPRDEMAYIMECAGDERAQRLMKALVDPRYRKRTLPWMARECGLSYMDIVMLIRNHRIGDGTVRNVWDGAPGRLAAAVRRRPVSRGVHETPDTRRAGIRTRPA